MGIRDSRLGPMAPPRLPTGPWASAPPPKRKARWTQLPPKPKPTAKPDYQGQIAERVVGQTNAAPAAGGLGGRLAPSRRLGGHITV
jgi:hypothetical protein